MKRILLLIIPVLGLGAGILGIHYYLGQTKFEKTPLFLEKNPEGFSTSTRKGSFLNLKNTRFRFKENISLDITRLTAELIPKGNSSIVNFDDVNSFLIKIANGEAYADASVLEVLFKDYVFKFDGSPLKLDKIEMLEGSDNKIRMTGEMNLFIWLNFEMIGTLSLDKASNNVVITAEDIRAVVPTNSKPILGMIGLNLEKLLTIPEGRGIAVKKNQIFVSVFSIIPPPQMEGTIGEIAIKNKRMYLRLESPFEPKFPPPPEPNVSNYLHVYRGEVKFGKLFMVDANMQMIDKDQKDPMDFYLEKYFVTLTSGGSAVINPDQSVKVYMPDYSDVTGR